MSDFTDRFLSIFTEHPQQTRSPQSYLKHGTFAIYNSLILIIAGSAGIIHGIIPKLFPFYTSTTVIHSFQKILTSGRHDNEILNLFKHDNKSFIIYPDSKSPNYNNVQNLQLTITIKNEKKDDSN